MAGRRRLLDATVGRLVSFLEHLVPKRRGRIVVAGPFYEGNPSSLIDGLRAHGYEVRWFTDLGRLRRHWFAARAQAVFVTHSPADAGPVGAWMKRRKLIYLPHGIPLKRMALAAEVVDPRIERNVAKYHHVVVSSPFEAALWARCLPVPEEAMWPTGYPRNTAFSADQKPLCPFDLEGPVFLYAPTFRRKGTLGGLGQIPGVDLQRFDSALAAMGAHVLVRPHPYTVADDLSRLHHVHDASNRIFPSLESLLPFVDGLITDYSSTYFDFLLADKPLVFVAYDQAAYEADRGLLLPYDQYTPGQHAPNAPKLVAALRAIVRGDDPHADERRALRAIVHEGTDDGKAIGRIVEHLAGAGVRPR